MLARGGGSCETDIIEKIGRPSNPKLPMLPLGEARRTRAGDSSAGSKFGTERMPKKLAATAAETATIKLGGGGCGNCFSRGSHGNGKCRPWVLLLIDAFLVIM